jgi:uncharacterized alpha-E superfamily protein
MPRSLRSCYEEIVPSVDELGAYYGHENGCRSLANETRRHLAEGDMNTTFQSGLHGFLADFNRPQQSPRQRDLVDLPFQ